MLFRSEAARCDRLGVLLDGRLVAVDTPAALCAKAGTTDLGAAFLALTGTAIAGEEASRKEAFKAKVAAEARS